MSAQELITEHLDLWTGAVTKTSSSGRGNNGKVELTGLKKLRELILKLAVTGRLVEQDAGDEPASDLIQRINAERLKLEGKGKVRATKKAVCANTVEPMPHAWATCTLGTCISLISGQHLKGDEYFDDKRPDSIPYLTGPAEYGTRTPEPQRHTFERRAVAGKGDILITCKGSGVGKLNIASEEIAISRQLMAARPILINAHFLYLLLDSLRDAIREKTVGIAIPGISRGDILNANIQLPPLDEQHRIVQKVGELMALCDRLEQQTSDQLEAHETLVDTLLGTLTQSANATELADNWARLAAHFDTLFTTEQSIDKLKQTILQLAVMGRLVEQDAGDEPTESLLTKIDQEIASLVKQGHIKKPKPTPEISDNDKFFGIPDSWQWVRLGSLALHSEAGWSPKCHGAPRENQGWAALKVSAVTWGEFRPDENKELPSNLTPRPEYEVHPSDFLISRANTSELVARSVVVPKGAPTKLMMSDKIIRFVFSNQVEPLYVNLFNNSPYARSYYFSVAGGTSSSMKNVSRAQIQALAVPLPPTAEQTRIVQKVGELMALCDQLKERLNQASETRYQLAESVVEISLT
ncbi:restriction endonuclease subunit S [Marinobacter sp. M5B]|uniref:restriction endonuclease subunit S n=1 Tax=Marinobacter sp. M5B TaxID=3141535 RepID=UPI0036D2719E